MKLKLVIEDRGDPSVGISPLYAEVTISIKDNVIRNEMDEISDKEMLKGYLAIFYDVPRSNIVTEKEYKRCGKIKLDKKTIL